MLGFTREELLAWATSERLAWLTDSSNLDLRFDRNFLRLAVLPRIRERWPAAARTAGRVAAQAAEALDLEAEVAGADLGLVEEGSALSLERLDLLPPARQRWVLRAWLRGLRLPVPSAATLESLRHDMAASATDRVPCTNWPGARVYRYRGRLHAVAEGSVRAVLPSGDWTVGCEFDLGALGHLRLEPAVGGGLSRARLPQLLQVVSRADGENFHPAGGRMRRPLRKWLQERGVLPWRRAQVPLVTAGGEIVAVGDLAYGGGSAAAPGEPSWKVVWSGRPPLTEQEALEVKRDR